MQLLVVVVHHNLIEMNSSNNKHSFISVEEIFDALCNGDTSEAEDLLDEEDTNDDTDQFKYLISILCGIN